MAFFSKVSSKPYNLFCSTLFILYSRECLIKLGLHRFKFKGYFLFIYLFLCGVGVVFVPFNRVKL